MLPVTAQFVLSATRETQVLLWIGVLILVVVVGGIGAMLVRRRLLDKDAGAAGTAGFLDELRAMQRRGEISPEEFEATRKAMSAKIRSGVSTPESVKQLRARAARARGVQNSPGVGAEGVILAGGHSRRPNDDNRKDDRDEQHGSHRDPDRSDFKDDLDGGGGDGGGDAGGGGDGGGGGD